MGQILPKKLRNSGTSNLYQFAPENNFGPNSTLQAKERRNIKPFSVRSLKLTLGQIPHSNQRNSETSNHYQYTPKNSSNFYKLATKNVFWAKFHITSQGIQKHQIFISSVVKMDLGRNSTFEAKECRNIKPLSVRS